MKKLILVLAATLGLQAYAGPSAAILNRITYQVITQTYVDMAAAGGALQSSVDLLATQKTQANLDAAQENWRQMRQHWEASESFLFGPVESLGIDPSIDTWPVNRGDLEEVLHSNLELNKSTVGTLGSNLQGFHTIEYLLFGNGVQSNHKDISALTSREIDYLRACTQLLLESSSRLANAWTNGFAQVVANPGFDNQVYPSEAAVLTEFVNGMLAIVDEVGTGKLARPMGADIGHANPEAVESPFSWNSLTDFTNNIQSVLNLFTGEYNGTAGAGVRDAVARRDPALAANVEQRIRHTMVSIQAIAGDEHLDFRQAIVSGPGRARISAASAELAALHQIILEQVLPIVSR